MARRVRIINDIDPLNPRVDYDNCFKIYTWEDRYNSPDDHGYSSVEDFKRELAFENDWDVQELVEGKLENEVWEILYSCARSDGGYDSSDAIAYACAKVSKQVDALIDKALDDYFIVPIRKGYDELKVGESNQVGWAVCDPKTLDEEWDGDVDKATYYLLGELETYNYWANGDVWGYVIEESDCCESCGNTEWNEVDSCYGFFGYDLEDNGMKDNLSDSDFELAVAADREYH